MYYSSLRLKNYRSYSDYIATFSPGVNIIVGPNASGKTNLLEALLVVSRGGSFRAPDSDLIYFNEPWARIEAETDSEHERVVTIKRIDGGSVKTLKIDNVGVKRLTQDKIIPVVLFEPEHLRMIHGSPTIRRDYIDGILQNTVAGYGTTLRNYKRVLAQRNRLLKLGRYTNDEFFIWDVKLAELGAEIVAQRIKTIESINQKAKNIYSALSNIETDIMLKYSTPLSVQDYASALTRELHARIQTDIQRGFTGVGPHREDIIFTMNTHNAQNTASRGETRTLILMCKLVELELLEQQHGSKPLLLLDDVFSELDASRRRALTEYLSEYQTIITTTDADAVIDNFIGDYKVIPLTKED